MVAKERAKLKENKLPHFMINILFSPNHPHIF